tara:strand:+ start:24 stop:383 length:360 start_codon:yes stop_codon:yes gene_type:complete
MVMWEWIGKNSTQLGILLAVIPIAWAAVQYLWAQRNELKHRRFETYHDLIKKLVQSEDPDQTMMLDRQIAIIFELRNFKEYYPVSLRILRGLKDTWSDDKRRRVREEIDESINFISKKI